MIENQGKHNRFSRFSTAVYTLLSALTGAATGLLLALLFYGAVLSSAPASVWRSWHFLYTTTGVGCAAGALGGLGFSLLFFRRDVGRFIFVKFLLFCLASLAAAAMVYGIAMRLYSNLFAVGYNAALFFCVAAVPWLSIGAVALFLRARMRRRW